MNIKPTNISDEEKTRIFEESLKNQTPYVEKEPIKIQPVKHGKWLSRCEGDIYEFSECSECGNMESRETPYCAQCGARMDGEQNER